MLALSAAPGTSPRGLTRFGSSADDAAILRSEENLAVLDADAR